MRNLKKILALVLALMMAISVMVFASAANFDGYEDKDAIDPDYAEAVEVLTGMGIFKGYSGGFQPKENVRRSEVAALVYRILTADVNDKQAHIWANDEFDDLDTDASRWAEGYIGYAAGYGYVVGNGQGQFMPEDYVTGYQLLVIMLRALGYGQMGEFTGSEWEKNVATRAADLGITDGFTTPLSEQLTREEVAYLLFNAIGEDVKQVNYTPALGYYWDVGESIGKEFFGLTKGTTTEIDKWGRPGYYWYNEDTNVNYATIEEVPVKTYDEAVTECDLADDIGLEDVKTYTLYTNGKYNDSKYEVQPLDTVQKIGAQGTRTEVYEDVIVTIDTFLAQVVDVKDATYDANNHLKTDSKITLVVYTDGTADTTDGEYVYQTNDSTNYTYAKGDMVLVNAWTDNTVNNDGSVTANNIGGNDKHTGTSVATAVKADHIVINGLAVARTGAQTYLWGNVPQHTVNNTTYDDAKWFKLDQAGTETVNHTWYFDGNDNLMGVTDIATQYTYGIVESIQWQNPSMATGYALATVRYMDGSTAPLVVTHIDGKGLTYADATAVGDFSAGKISTTLQNNAGECGKHLYRIETSAIGTVTLEQVFTDADNNGHNYNTSSGAITTTELNQLANATIKTGIAAITGTATGTVTGATSPVYVNSDTTFLVRNGVYAGSYTYSVVKGYENIDTYSGTAQIDWVNLDGDVYADYVFVTGSPDSAETAGLFYLTSDNVQAVLSNGVVDYYVIQGIVDGVPGTIKVDNAMDGSDDLIDLFVPSYKSASTTSYVNRMFAVDYTNGVVTNVCNGNAPLSTDWALSGASDVFVNTTTTYTGLNIAAWYDNGTGTASYDGQVLEVNGNRYNVVGLNPVVGSYSADMKDKEIYVIYDPNNTIAGAYVAKAVYIADPADAGQGSGVTPGNATINYVVNVYNGGTLVGTLTSTWTGPAGTYPNQNFTSIQGKWPTFNATNYTIVKDQTSVTVTAGQVVTLEYTIVL